MLKRANYRSRALPRSLGFQEGAEPQRVEFGAETDEPVMVKMAALPENQGRLN